MYQKRIKIFIGLIVALLAVCVFRLVQMQLLADSSLHEEIESLKRQKGAAVQFKTARGRILDRKARELAFDEPKFYLCLDYKLTRFADERVITGKLLRAERRDKPEELKELKKQIREKRKDLFQIIDKCTYFGLTHSEVESVISQINNDIWNVREYLAWKRKYPNSGSFEQAVADANDRLLLITGIDIAEMHKSWPLLELKTDDDIFTAQLEFMNITGVKIIPKGQRQYPYGSMAAQTIGWVGLVQDKERLADVNDRLSTYLKGEVCGRRPGVEYVCEAILRGRRGEEIYDIDHQLISKAETQLGQDVTLTLDIELQKTIEEYLSGYKYNEDCKGPIAAVVIDVASGEILAMVSLPTFDLNHIRNDYADIIQDPNQPLINRATYGLYPPGSVIKPLILIAGLESGNIGADEVISCPSAAAPEGWPNCYLYNKHSVGHDSKWENNARNAIKGSCNVYFSRLANRINSVVLQQWLYKFGYGRSVLSPPAAVRQAQKSRDFRQSSGIISSSILPKNATFSIEKFPLKHWEKRYFGMGQGNLRVTVLQVANAMAAIARDGLYRKPELFKEIKGNSNSDSIDLNISPRTLAVVRDGMRAVINEWGGTAYDAFVDILHYFNSQGVKVYGKTGSTERPEHAWFGGFAEDDSDRSIAIAVVVEGGQAGGEDAAPLGCDIINFCIEAGYIGN